MNERQRVLRKRIQRDEWTIKSKMFDSLVHQVMSHGLHNEFVAVTDAKCGLCGKMRFAMVMGTEGDGFNNAHALLQRVLNGESFTAEQGIDALEKPNQHIDLDVKQANGPYANPDIVEMIAKGLGADVLYRDTDSVIMGVRKKKEKDKDERNETQRRTKINIEDG